MCVLIHGRWNLIHRRWILIHEEGILIQVKIYLFTFMFLLLLVYLASPPEMLLACSHRIGIILFKLLLLCLVETCVIAASSWQMVGMAFYFVLYHFDGNRGLMIWPSLENYIVQGFRVWISHWFLILTCVLNLLLLIEQ